MADNYSRKSRLGNPTSEPSYDVFDEDPLVELARIVSEDGGYFNMPDRRQREAQRAVEAEPAPQSGDDELGLDLESQLMEELEMSMADPSDEVYGDDFDAADYDDGDEYEPVDERYEDQNGYAPEDSATLTRMSEEPVGVAASFDEETYGSENGQWAEDLTEEFADEPVEQPVFSEHARHAPADPAAQDSNPDDDYSISGSPAGSLLSAEELAELHEAVARDGELRSREPVDLETEFSAALSGERVDDDDGGIGIPPVIPLGERYGPDRRDATVQGKRSGRKLMAIAAVLSIAVLGGGVVAMMNSTSLTSSKGTPPVIKADTSPVKVQAEESDVAASESDQQPVFDIASNQGEQVEEVLRDRTEKPVDRIIPLEESQPTGVLRPVGSDAAGQGEKTTARWTDESASGTSAPKFDPIGPKTVTTWKVGPDGKIIRPAPGQVEEQASVGSDSAADEPMIVGGLPTPVEEPAMSAGAEEEPKPVPVNVVDVKTGPSDEGADVQSESTSSPLADVVADLSNGGAAGSGTPLPRARPAEAESLIASAELPEQPVLVAKPANPVQGGSGPVNLLEAARQGTATRTAARQATPVNTGSTAPATSSGYVVQLSSQRSEEQAQAAFNGLKQRFPELLGNRTPNIQRADLGDRGIYYRVRVGPMADREGAVQFCEQLKSSGGSCFVTR